MILLEIHEGQYAFYYLILVEFFTQISANKQINSPLPPIWW